MERKEPVLKELKEIAPLLALLPKEVPFRVPENYFDDLLSETLVAVGVKEADEKDFGMKNSPFEIPEQYFENLSSEILEKTKKQDTEKIRRGRVLSFNRMVWLAAASITIIMIISISFFRTNKVETIASSPIDTTYLLLENATGLSEAMIVEFYSAELPASVEDSSLNQFLPEAVGIDADAIYSL